MTRGAVLRGGGTSAGGGSGSGGVGPPSTQVANKTARSSVTIEGFMGVYAFGISCKHTSLSPSFYLQSRRGGVSVP